jgi:glycine cleavage system transcriptional repressor
MNKLLALSALGPDGPTLVQDFAAAILDSGCNILESRVTRLGSEIGIQMLVAGNWRTVARLEQSLPALAGELKVEIHSHAAVQPDARDDMLPYAIDLVSMDQPGIVYRVVKFLSQRGVRITDLSTSSYTAQQTGASMVSLRMSIAIPSTNHIATLREDFLMLCDELNLDAVLEPIKG